MNENDNGTIRSSFWSNLFRATSNRDDLRNIIISVPIFKDLNQKEISFLSALIHDRNYLAGEYVFYQGDPGIGMYIIRDGIVSIKRTIETNNTFSLATLNTGDFFGELALVDGEKRSASAVAVTDVKLAVIFKPDLDEFIDKFPRKGIKILQGMTEIVTARLRKLNEDHISLQTKFKIKSEENYGT